MDIASFFRWSAIVSLVASSMLVLGGSIWAEEFHGQVVSTTGNELAISAAGDTIRFEVSSDAIISLDGQPVELGQLTPDHLADVSAKRNGDGWLATLIEAQSQRVIVERTGN